MTPKKNAKFHKSAKPSVTDTDHGHTDTIILTGDDMAIFYLHQPHANVPGACRKSIQALSSLLDLPPSLEG